MYATPDHFSGYAKALPIVTTNQDRWKREFLAAASKIEAARGESGNPGALYRAVADNQSLWTRFANQAIAPGSKMDRTTKSQILSLLSFVISHSSKVMADGATPQPLVNIAVSLARATQVQKDLAA